CPPRRAGAPARRAGATSQRLLRGQNGANPHRQASRGTFGARPARLRRRFLTCTGAHPQTPRRTRPWGSNMKLVRCVGWLLGLWVAGCVNDGLVGVDRSADERDGGGGPGPQQAALVSGGGVIQQLVTRGNEVLADTPAGLFKADAATLTWSR